MMKMFIQKKHIVGILFLGLGFITTQFYQNCAPVALEGFANLSSELSGHSDTGMGEHPTTEKQKQLPMQRNLVVPKEYVAALFREVFTSAKYPISNLETAIDKWIYFKGAQYGGNCSLYSSYSAKDCSGVVANTNLGVYNDDNTVRESYRIQICEHVLGVDAGVHAALEKVALVSTSSVTAESIAAVYGLFYRNDPPNVDTVNTLLDLNRVLVEAKATPINRWRAILTQVCESPSWQLL